MTSTATASSSISTPPPTSPPPPPPPQSVTASNTSSPTTATDPTSRVGVDEVAHFQRSDWIRRLFPPKFKIQSAAESIQQLDPSSIEEIFHASEIVIAWVNSNINSLVGAQAKALTMDEVFVLTVYNFDFGCDGQNERSPQNILNRALSLRTTVELLRVRWFLYNFLSSLRKLPRFRFDPCTPGAAAHLFVPIGKDGYLGGFNLIGMLDSVAATPDAAAAPQDKQFDKEEDGQNDMYERFYDQCSAASSFGGIRGTARRGEESLVGTLFGCPAFISAYTSRAAALDKLSAQAAALSTRSFSYHNPNIECAVAGTLVDVSMGQSYFYDIQPFAMFPADSRVLLEADRAFRVVSIIHEGGLRTVQLAIIDTPGLLQDLIPPQGEVILQSSAHCVPPALPPQLSKQSVTNSSPTTPSKKGRNVFGPIQNFVSSAIYGQVRNIKFHYFDTEELEYDMDHDVDASKSDIIFSASTAATVVPAPTETEDGLNGNNKEEEEEDADENGENGDNENGEDDYVDDGCIVEVMPENNPSKKLERLIFALSAQDMMQRQADLACRELEAFTMANWQEPYFNELFLRLNGVEYLLNVVLAFPPNLETFRSVCGILARVRCSNDDVFTQDNTIYVLLECFEMFFKDRGVCTRYLQMVCANFGERAVAIATGIGSVLVYLRALDCHYDSPDVCESAFRLLILFAKHNDEVTSIIARAMRVESFFCFVKKYADCVPIVNQIFGVFALLVNSVVDYDKLLVDHGVIPLLISYIRRPYAYEPGTPCYFCALITRLIQNESYRQKLIGDGCVRAIRQLIADNITNTSLCVSCCTPLDILSRKPAKKGSPAPGPSAGVILFTQVLGNKKNDAATIRSVCLTIKFLTEPDKDKCQTFVQNGGIGILLRILKRHPEVSAEMPLQTAVCTLLYSVFDTCTEDPTILAPTELKKFVEEFPEAVDAFTKNTELALKICSIYYIIATEYMPKYIQPDIKSAEFLLKIADENRKAIMVCQYVLTTIEKYYEHVPVLVERPEDLERLISILEEYIKKSDTICTKAIMLIAHISRAENARFIFQEVLKDALIAINSHARNGPVGNAFCILINTLLERDSSMKKDFINFGIRDIICKLNVPRNVLSRCTTLLKEGLLSLDNASDGDGDSNSPANEAGESADDGDKAMTMKRKRGKWSFDTNIGRKREGKVVSDENDDDADYYSSEDEIDEYDECYSNDDYFEDEDDDDDDEEDDNEEDNEEKRTKGERREESNNNNNVNDYIQINRDEAMEKEASEIAKTYGSDVPKEVLEDLISSFGSEDAATVKRATGTVKYIVQKSNDLKVLSVGLGVVHAASAAIETHAANTDICSNVLSIFQTLSSARESCAIFLENGGLDPLAWLAEHHSVVHFCIRAQACAALCSYVESGLVASLSIDPVRYLTVVAGALVHFAETDLWEVMCERFRAAVCSGLEDASSATIAAFVEAQLPMLLDIPCTRTTSQRGCRAAFDILSLYANNVVKNDLNPNVVRRNGERIVDAVVRALDVHYAVPEVCEVVVKFVSAFVAIDLAICETYRRDLCTKLSSAIEANINNRSIVLPATDIFFRICDRSRLSSLAAEKGSKRKKMKKGEKGKSGGDNGGKEKDERDDGNNDDDNDADDNNDNDSSVSAEMGEIWFIFGHCYPTFARVFQQTKDIPQMYTPFLKYLDFLASTDDGILLLQSSVCVQIILQWLAACGDAKMCTGLILALCNIAKRKPNGAELVLSNGGLDAVMAAVCAHPESREIVQLFCYIVCLFTAKVINATYVGSFPECMDLLIDTFRRYKDDSTVCDLFCSAVKKLIPVGQSAAKFANSAFLTLLLGVMKAQTTSQKLCENMAGLLCMIEYPTQDRAFLAAFVADLFDVMASHSASEVLLNECTLILSSLAERDGTAGPPYCCPLIATEERIRALLSAFAAAQKSDTRESICLIIANIIEKANNGNNPTETTTSSQQQQIPQPPIKKEEESKKRKKKKGSQQNNLNNLNNLNNINNLNNTSIANNVNSSNEGNSSKAIAKFIGENGGVTMILGFMKAHLESAFMCDKPVRALQALARYVPNATQIVDGGLEKIMAKCMQNMDPERRAQFQKFCNYVLIANETACLDEVAPKRQQQPK